MHWHSPIEQTTQDIKIYFQFFKKHSDVFRFNELSGWVSLNSSSEDSDNSKSISVPKQEELSSLGNASNGRSNQSLPERYEKCHFRKCLNCFCRTLCGFYLCKLLQCPLYFQPLGSLLLQNPLNLRFSVIFENQNIVFIVANCRALFFLNVNGTITGPQNQSKKPCNKQLINLNCSVFTGKSQASALPY